MRVISQDRRYSFDFDRASFLRQENYISALIAGENRYIFIGRYETEMRAEEVFEDMHKAYGPYGLICDKLSEEQIQAFCGSKNLRMPVINMDNMDCTVTTYDSVVYYMPEV